MISQPGGRPAPYRAAWHAPAAQAPEEEQAPLGAKWVAHEGGDGNETAVTRQMRANVSVEAQLLINKYLKQYLQLRRKTGAERSITARRA